MRHLSMLTGAITLFVVGFIGVTAQDQGSKEEPKPLRVVQGGVPSVTDKDGNEYPLGRKAPAPERLRAAHAASMKFAQKMKVMSSRGVPAEYDSTTLGIISPIRDQGPCGSCHHFSACSPATSAMIKAGNWANDGNGFSEQQQIDCHRDLGGCNGGWEWDDAERLMTAGGARDADYGPYRANHGNCKQVKLYKISEMGMCSPGVDGVARTIDIQNSIIEYGEVSISVAADNAFANYRSGLFNGSGSRQVNHAVTLVGWKTANGVVYWKLKNSWGVSWGESGYMWCKAGANMAGGDAFWVRCDSINPPLPPDPPDPPGPPPLVIGRMTWIDGRTYDVLPGGTLDKTLRQLIGPMNP